ncbi:MAG: dienelactone hydrolase family protein [Planctomycetes bacterium]|nr:dienelactone hydrolase family protein [Planctomycetota bacterium]
MRYVGTCICVLLSVSLASAQALPGTQLLRGDQDFAQLMVDGIHRYLDKQTVLAEKDRAKYWKPDFTSVKAFHQSVQGNRERLRKMIGVVDQRVPVIITKIATVEQGSLVAQTKYYKVYAIRWSVLPGMNGEGLLLEPTGKPRACAVAIPDADWTPEQLVGVAAGVPKNSQYARRLAEDGYRVIVPMLINRQDDFSGSARIGRFTNQPHREFIYRMGFEMGRHIIGYEVQKVLAAIDWLQKGELRVPPVEIWGYGEGGLIALYSAAIDPRITDTYVSGYVNNRNELHREPIYRNVFGLLKEFGDAELLMLAGAPNGARKVNVEYSTEPNVKGPPTPRKGRSGGAAPGMLGFADPKVAFAEYEKFRTLTKFEGRSLTTLEAKPFADLMDPPIDAASQKRWKARMERETQPKELRLGYDPNVRQKRQFDEAVDFTQNQLTRAVPRRQQSVWNKLKTSSLDALRKSQEPIRQRFHEDIIGKLPASKAPLNPRTRKMYETAKYTAYEVVLDLNEDVICHGILLVPKGIKPGEKRPCVVCQHGLEGRPSDVCNPKVKTAYYNSFGTQLAERGFVVFAPQNPYIFKNHFRQAVRKANPLGLSLYSFIVAQHERIIDFLETLPFVDPARIAYYGLSYGGKVAMRIPSLVLRYCLSICSGDFNEWIWKNINLDWQGSYMFTGEYEMYEFDLGNTFNYAEMAALIAPRPFMVERGHSDGVGLDEYVAFEYAKVRRFYAQLGIGNRTEIEFFIGGHVIQGRGTFAFLHRHLKWAAPK